MKYEKILGVILAIGALVAFVAAIVVLNYLAWMDGRGW